MSLPRRADRKKKSLTPPEMSRVSSPRAGNKNIVSNYRQNSKAIPGIKGKAKAMAPQPFFRVVPFQDGEGDGYAVEDRRTGELSDHHYRQPWDGGRPVSRSRVRDWTRQAMTSRNRNLVQELTQHAGELARVPHEELYDEHVADILKEHGMEDEAHHVLTHGTNRIPRNDSKSMSSAIPGGLAEGMSPTDFDQQALAEGIQIEMEHTSDPAIAREIAMDHLVEDPHYYRRLGQMEKKSAKREYANARRSPMGWRPEFEQPEDDRHFIAVLHSSGDWGVWPNRTDNEGTIAGVGLIRQYNGPRPQGVHENWQPGQTPYFPKEEDAHAFATYLSNQVPKHPGYPDTGERMEVEREPDTDEKAIYHIRERVGPERRDFPATDSSGRFFAPYHVEHEVEEGDERGRRITVGHVTHDNAIRDAHRAATDHQQHSNDSVTIRDNVTANRRSRELDQELQDRLKIPYDAERYIREDGMRDLGYSDEEIAAHRQMLRDHNFSEKSLQSHKHGCLMAAIPDPLAKKITTWTSKNIPDEWLGSGGREDTPHVTVLYGFTDCSEATVERLREMLAALPPFQLRLVAVSVFPSRGEGDVLKADVYCPELHHLNREILTRFKVHCKYDVYRPHLTLAYLCPEFTEQALRNLPPFIGAVVTVDTLVFSGPDGKKVRIKLRGTVGQQGTKAAPRRYYVRPVARPDGTPDESLDGYDVYEVADRVGLNPGYDVPDMIQQYEEEGEYPPAANYVSGSVGPDREGRQQIADDMNEWQAQHDQQNEQKAIYRTGGPGPERGTTQIVTQGGESLGLSERNRIAQRSARQLNEGKVPPITSPENAQILRNYKPAAEYPPEDPSEIQEDVKEIRRSKLDEQGRQRVTLHAEPEDEALYTSQNPVLSEYGGTLQRDLDVQNTNSGKFSPGGAAAMSRVYGEERRAEVEGGLLRRVIETDEQTQADLHDIPAQEGTPEHQLLRTPEHQLDHVDLHTAADMALEANKPEVSTRLRAEAERRRKYPLDQSKEPPSRAAKTLSAYGAGQGEELIAPSQQSTQRIKAAKPNSPRYLRVNLQDTVDEEGNDIPGAPYYGVWNTQTQRIISRHQTPQQADSVIETLSKIPPADPGSGGMLRQNRFGKKKLSPPKLTARKNPYA